MEAKERKREKDGEVETKVEREKEAKRNKVTREMNGIRRRG